ncbi:MAG: C39 family peptidase [Ruminococcus sp.]|nr:C39 family peptidase [Ruminococcus sp.]
MSAVHPIFRKGAAILSCAALTITNTMPACAEGSYSYLQINEDGTYTELYTIAESDISQEGWYTPDGGETFSYFYEDGTWATGASVLPDGYTYIFTTEGTLKTGWQLAGGSRYYYSPFNGQIQLGWVSYMNKTYYVDAETGKVTGTVTIDGAECVFDSFGALISKTEPGISYDVPYYAQADERWGGVYIGDKTIARVGCLTSCMAMMHSYYTGTEITPDVMCKQYLTYSNNSLLWAEVYNLGYQVIDVTGKGNAANLALLYEKLQTGPVIVGATNVYGGMHYVLVTGCTNTDTASLTASDFQIHDPGFENKSTLDEHFADYGNWYQFYCK